VSNVLKALMEKHDRRMTQVTTLLELTVVWAELVVALILAAVVIGMVVHISGATFEMFRSTIQAGEKTQISSVIKAVLDTFIVIELFRITIAYVRHHEVVDIVLETALVVAAREIVVIEAGAKDPLAATAVGGTLLAIGITWYLLRKSLTQNDRG